MGDIFVIKGSKIDVAFFNPILTDKDTLSFGFSSISNISGFYKSNKFIIKIKNSKKTYNVKLKEEDIKVLNDLFNKEKKDAKSYYNRSINGSIELLIIDNWVTTEDILNHNNSPYFQRILRKSVEKFTGGEVKDTNEEVFQKEFQKSIGLIRLNHKNDAEGIVRIKLLELYE